MCPSSRTIAATNASNSSFGRPSAPTSTAASSAQSSWKYEFYTLATYSTASTAFSRSSMPSPIGTTITDPTKPLAIPEDLPVSYLLNQHTCLRPRPRFAIDATIARRMTAP
jgi:hypothetical protein